MGCQVNKPGKAKIADIGLTFSGSNGFYINKEKISEKVEPEKASARLKDLILF